MSTRATRNSVRTSSPATQHLNKNFVSGGSVQPANIPVVTYTPPKPAAPPAPAAPAAEVTKDADGDVSMETTDAPPADVELDQDEAKAERRKYWLNVKKTPGLRKKPNKQLLQRRLRKHITPKNATVALQEVCPGVTYKFATMPGGPGVFTAEVEVNGKQFHGVGSSKSLARAAAAELALQSFVKTPTLIKDEQGKETVEDSTPWAALAGFALHKLFCDWRQGRVGAPLSVDGATPAAPEEAAKTTAVAAAAFKTDAPAGTFQSFSVPPLQVEGKEKKKATPKAAKTLPVDAASRHPVMLLHEMRPTVTFDTVEHTMTQPGGVEGPSFTIAVTTDGQTFKGKARTKKQAKRLAAKEANTALFEIQYPPEEE